MLDWDRIPSQASSRAWLRRDLRNIRRLSRRSLHADDVPKDNHIGNRPSLEQRQ